MKTKSNIPTVKELQEHYCGVDQITFRNGVFTFRKGFFYTMGGSEDKLRTRLEKTLTGAGFKFKYIDGGEKWTAFGGGSSLANSSHWWIKAEITR